ncbi:MAG: hypothetical protein M0Z61_18115 [Nitrospiraceae bacterium]|nr:hypothetical protein [Nitrospiraceae bacterium]
MNEEAKNKDTKSTNSQELRAGLYGEIISHMRVKHPEAIEEAYEFFWEEEFPEDFLSGLPLELGFVNFEDWFICDYKDPKCGFITDLYLEETGQREDADKSASMLALKNSCISLYEAKKISDSQEGEAELEDVLLGGTHQVAVPVQGMKTGDFFATRIIKLSGNEVMGACLYPFGAATRPIVLEAIKGQFERYRKNKRPGGGLSDFLKEESYIFNTIWLSGLYKQA